MRGADQPFCLCLAQSLVLAGLFAWMEGLFALGYRPRLHADLKRRIEEAIAKNKLPAEPLLSKGDETVNALY